MGQEWLKATTGMPGVIELELGRSVYKKNNKKTSKAGVVSQ